MRPDASVLQDALMLYLASKDRRLGRLRRVAVWLIGGYLMSPARVLMDLIPVLGWIELLAAGLLHATGNALLPEHIRQQYGEEAARADLTTSGALFATIIMLCWVTMIAAVLFLVLR
jgi:uncharacterized membrane protein YkvA (DUF1232 family)